VDFDLRQKLLARSKSLSAEEAWQERESGLPKLWLIQRTLALRGRRPDLFDASAGYEPLAARGTAAANVVAFRRGEGLIAVVPRLVLSLGGDWRETALDLPSGRWRNYLTGEELTTGSVLLAHLLRRFPVALLTRKENA
jgi:(1->4)-alpha-D-glucan 1-alpha-D-glucosylmutase